MKKREARTELVNLHGVVNDEINGDLGINLRRVAPQRCHGIAHGSQIDDTWDAGEVLQDDPGWLERQLCPTHIPSIPVRQANDVSFGDSKSVYLAQ